MMAAGTYRMSSSSRFVIWLIGVSFVLFQFFLQLSSGMVIGAIMHDMSFSALKAGILSSALYIVYTALQIPVGVLFDNKNTKKLLAINAFICGLGCLLFARSHTFAGLFLSRALSGMGSAFAFIGLSHLLRQHFPLKQFGFLIGVSETVGFIGTVIGIMGLGALINDWGWRGFINGAGMVGLLIAFSCWRYIPNNAPSTNPASYYYQQLFQILRNKKAWINGIFIALTFTVVTSFGALWAVPFIQVKLHCDLQKAGFLCALFFLGTGFSCPLFGYLSAMCLRRKPLILSSCLSTTFLLLVLLYIPLQNVLVIAGLLFLTGLCCGAYLLAYTIANELAPPGALSTSTGFTNALAVATTPILQTFIGYLLVVSNHTGTYALIDYQRALLTIPVSLLLASILAYFLPEKD